MKKNILLLIFLVCQGGYGDAEMNETDFDESIIDKIFFYQDLHSIGAIPDSKEAKFLEGLWTLAKQHDIETKDAINIMAKISYSRRPIVKGSVGLITENVSIITNSFSNKVVFSNGKEWIGSRYDVSEIITIVNGEPISSYSSNQPFEELIVIHFMPKGIHVFDLLGNRGLYFDRNIQETRTTGHP